MRPRSTDGAVACRLGFVAALALAFAMLGVSPALAQNPFPLAKDMVPSEMRPHVPLPIGISFFSMSPNETVDITNLQLALGGQQLPPGVVSLPSVTQSTHVNGVRGDIWLFPFVNLYGTVGKVTGTASNINPIIAPGMFPPGVTVPASLNYSGNMVGGGMTLALGYKFLFATYDLNYSSSRVDLITDRITSITHAIRAGYLTTLKKVKVSVYSGAFFESIRGSLAGSGLFQGINPDFSVVATPHAAWNALAGANVYITPHLVVSAEGGFGDRMHFMISPGVRF